MQSTLLSALIQAQKEYLTHDSSGASFLIITLSIKRLSCKEHTVNPFSSIINLEGWGGEEDGREFQIRGDISIPVADSC